MTENDDPSRARDATAAATATDRSIASSTRFDALEKMVHGMKREQADIVALTTLLVARQEKMSVLQDQQAIQLAQNTAATQQIATNTSPLVDLATDLMAGTRFMCRCANAVRFMLKEVVEPYWKPVAVVTFVYLAITQNHVPVWAAGLFKLLGG